MILADCGRMALHYHIMGHVVEALFQDVRTRAFCKLTTGDAAALERDLRTGDAATRLNNDIDVLNSFLAGNVSSFSRMIFQGAVALVGCLFLSWQMSLAYLSILPLTLWVVKRVSAPIQARTKRAMDSTGRAMSIAAEAIQGAQTVKAFAMEEEMARRFGAAVDSAYQKKRIKRSNGGSSCGSCPPHWSWLTNITAVTTAPAEANSSRRQSSFTQATSPANRTRTISPVSSPPR